MNHTDVPSDPVLRVKALESLLVEKGLVDPAALDVLVDTYENKVGPRNGAQVVAHAWVNPGYKQRLLDDGTAAIAELGYSGSQGEKLTVVENSAAVHNVIVCTLCSCYPWPLLGLPPTWYDAIGSLATQRRLMVCLTATLGVRLLRSFYTASANSGPSSIVRRPLQPNGDRHDGCCTGHCSANDGEQRI